tara:strand:+ start:63 stop:242 length:180 start_codon:yes stop_codon:yes gene_type:complete
MKTISFDPDLAFGIAKCTNNPVSKNLDDYMFMFADPKDLHFKHIDTREYVKVNHSEWIY